MAKVAIVTDSNSGITQQQAGELGIFVLPMPFVIDGEECFEDINLTQERFYELLESDADVSTSQPAVGDVIDLWEKILNEEGYDEIVHIPMSSGLSGSYSTAKMLSEDYEGKVEVVDNQRISVTQRQSVLEAMEMANEGKTALEIREYLEETKMDSIIYIMVNTLKYLKKGGRVTPAGAALGTILGIKPVLKIFGEKLDAFAKARSLKQSKRIMIDAIADFMEKNYKEKYDNKEYKLFIAYTRDDLPAKEFLKEVEEAYPGISVYVDNLSLSVSCHIGPGALALAVTVDD